MIVCQVCEDAEATTIFEGQHVCYLCVIQAGVDEKLEWIKQRYMNKTLVQIKRGADHENVMHEIEQGKK